jgi:hypothetical protein
VLLLAVPAVGSADIPWGAGGIVGALEACEAELATCQEEPGITFPGDGWPEDAYPSGGAPLSYTDNGDGTFTDDNTGLMWEIKDGADGGSDYANPHDVDNWYTWTDHADGDDTNPDGTAFTEFLAELNAEPGFAGHRDWRLPTVKELQSLVDYSVADSGPAVAEGLPGATAATSYYWSSTSYAYVDAFAWNVHFSIGIAGHGVKIFEYHVRAVRGGW